MTSEINTNPFENEGDGILLPHSNPFENECEPLVEEVKKNKTLGPENRHSSEEISVDSTKKTDTVPCQLIAEPSLREIDSTHHEAARTSDNNSNKVSFDAVAKKLLDENFLLTALELHTELMESGRDLRRLRDFFTNPANFEAATLTERIPLPSAIPRTSSAQTLDSLDFTRYSDEADREVGDKLAVSEFELRKAKETIKTLREQLTLVSEKGISSVSVPTGSSEIVASPSTDLVVAEDARLGLPHEKKAINFLINEYLLQNDFRLTSVTFSEEVADQDFEDWDEVGLNIPRPADLLCLYREFCHCNPVQKRTRDFSCNVDMDSDLDVEPSNPFLEDMRNTAELLNKLNEENAQLLARDEELTAHIERLSAEIKELRARQNDSEAKSSISMPLHVETKVPQKTAIAIEKDTIKRSRNVSQNFIQSLMRQIQKSHSVEDARIHEEICAVNSADKDELVDCLGRSLLHIIPNVLLNKRDEMIPLIVRAAVMHQDASCRESLLGSLFNLIKKPEEDQRRMIVSGCVAFAKLAGPTRSEAELLPHCWEQIGHKFVERRLLVAETCGAVAEHVPAELISSLILSMLQQMLLEDKSEHVREAVIKSLSVICLYIEDKDKFAQVSDLVQRALTDSSESSVVAGRNFLVPCFACWADELGKLQLGVVSLFVRKLGQIVLTSGVNQTANEVLLLNYFSCLQVLTPLLFRSVLADGPYSKAADSDLSCVVADLNADRYPMGNGALECVRVLFDSDEKLAGLTLAYDRHCGQEWFQSWNCLDYVLKDMLPQLLSILNSLEVALPRAVPAAVEYMNNFCRTFGRGLWSAKIKPLFGPPLFLPKDKDDLSNFSVSYATLPVYCAGVLSCFKTEEDWKELRYFLRSRLVEMAEKNVNTAAVTCTFVELCKVWDDCDALLSLVWEHIPHKSFKVRCLCAAVLSRIVRFVEVPLLRSRVLPGLVTLVADNDWSVRSSTVSGFGAILEVAAAEDDIVDKTRLQLSAVFEDSDCEVKTQLVRTLTLCAPNLESSFRDDFVVPQLAVLSMKNNAVSDGEARRRLSAVLFEAFSAYSCCFLSPEALSEAFIPGLRSLIKDLDPEHGKIASSILKDSEAKLASSNQAALESERKGLVTEVTVEEVRAKMLTRFRDFKDKMDQHRDTVPNLFKKK